MRWRVVQAVACPDPATRIGGPEPKGSCTLSTGDCVGLPDSQREVFVLRHIEERSTEEVAEVLGLSPGSVKRHLFRAIRGLRESLGDAR